MFQKLLATCILFLLLAWAANGQQTPGFTPPDTLLPVDTIFFDIDKDLAEQLWPLDSIIEIAYKNSPILAFEDAMIKARRYDLKYNRMMFFQGVSGFFSFRAGDNLQFTSGTTQQQIYQFSNGYNVGVLAQIPLSTFLGQGARNKTVKSEWEAAKYRKEVQKISLRREISKVYVDMMEGQRKIRIRVEDAQAAYVTVQIAELELIEGKIQSSEYSRLYNIHANAKSNLESERANFLRAFYDLEAMVGVELKYLKKPIEKKAETPIKPKKR